MQHMGTLDCNPVLELQKASELRTRVTIGSTTPRRGSQARIGRENFACGLTLRAGRPAPAGTSPMMMGGWYRTSDLSRVNSARHVAVCCHTSPIPCVFRGFRPRPPRSLLPLSDSSCCHAAATISSRQGADRFLPGSVRTPEPTIHGTLSFEADLLPKRWSTRSHLPRWRVLPLTKKSSHCTRAR